MSLALPVYEDEECNDYIQPSPRQILRIAINLKNLIDIVVPVALDESQITSHDSVVQTAAVMDAVLSAAGGIGSGYGSSARRYQACLIFCLLKVSGWYGNLMADELCDTDLYSTRSLAAQTIASVLIEREKEDRYLFLSLLCHRYTINLNDNDSEPENALELAVDMHSTIIISSSGYQRCIKWLWRGWIVQSSHDPSEYVLFRGKKNPNFLYHFDPDRIKTPLYQNFLEIFFSIIYLLIYTIIVNIDTDPKSLNIMEFTFILFTLGFVIDEFQKFYHIGSNYIQFSNAFNDILYCIIAISFSIRFMGVSSRNEDVTKNLDIVSYRLLSMAAPLMWSRMFFFLDLYQFFGVMIVIIKMMMKESIFFFFMLSVVILGFLQAFLGLDQADGKRDLTMFVITNMLQTVLSGADFNSIERFAYPYGSILYYIYTFIVSMILLNFLIALFSQAYSDIIANASDEYLAQYAARVLKYIRAPDAKLFFPPFNLIEIFFLDIPFSWWINRTNFSELCDKVMIVIYAPSLFFIANYEVKTARRIEYNRTIRVADDANEQNREWELTDGYDSDGETEQTIRQGLQRQRLAELEDPTFAINFNQWKTKLEKLAPPIEQAQAAGVSLDNYEIISKIDQLTSLVTELISQNKELKENLKSRK